MGIKSLSRTGFLPSSYVNYDDFLAGNAAYDPAATWLIQRITAAGGETSITFSSIPNTYKHLQIRAICRDTATTGSGAFDIPIQFNGDTGTNYAYHQLYGNGSTAVAAGAGSQNQMWWNGLSSGSYSSNTAAYGAGYCDILDYASTSKNKTMRALGGFDFNTASTAYKIQISSGLWISTAAITSIKFVPAVTAFAAGTTFALYGIMG